MSMKNNNFDILYIIGDFNLGGTEKHLLYILPLIKKTGLNIGVYTFKEKGILAPEFKEKNIEIKTVFLSRYLLKLPVFFRKFFGFIINVIQLFIIIQVYKPRILHMFLPEAYILGSISSFFNKKIIKIMSRRSKNYYFRNNKIIKILESYFHKKTNCLLANSKSVHSDLYLECKDHKKIKILYNGVKLQSENRTNISLKKITQIRKKFLLQDDDVIIVMLANFIPYKNHNLILNSIKELINKTTIQFKFLFIGQDRGIKKILVKSIDQLQISNRVCFIENVTNPNDLIKVADISVICSLHEGFSNAILESMAMGLPVIASNVGGNPEAIKNNYNGFIFDLKKSYELTNYLLLLIEDNKLRKKLGLNSIKRVEEHFNIDYCVSQYLKIYQSFNSLYER